MTTEATPPIDDWDPIDPREPQTTGLNGAHYPVAASKVQLEAIRQPTATDPLCGLVSLAKVALLGRDAILSKAIEPIPYIWQDIAVAGTIVVLAGGPGEGKTTLLFLLLVARMNQGENVALFGRQILKAPECRWIVLLEGEHGEISASRKLLRSCEIMGVHDAALSRIIIIARKAVHIGSPEWADVGRLVGAGLVSDIAIDTIARVAPADGNDEASQVAIFDLVARTIELAPSEETKPIVWAVAHTRKNGTTGDLSDVSGSVQRVGQADTVLLIKGEKLNGRVVSSTCTFSKLREEVDEHPMPVTWSLVREGARRSLKVQGEQPKDEGPLEEKVAARLELGPSTKNQLRDHLKRSSADIEEALSALFAAKRIRTTDIMVRGKPVRAFELRKEPVKVAGLWPDSQSDRTSADE